MVNNQILLTIDHLHIVDRVRIRKSDLWNMKTGNISILFHCLQEEFEDTEMVIRIRKIQQL
jgi:hypothetical protein